MGITKRLNILLSCLLTLALLVPGAMLPVAASASSSYNPGVFSTVSGVLSGNAALSGLTLSSGTLTPAFDPATLSYTVNVDNSVSSLSVTPTASDSNAAVSVNGGSPANPINLNVGENTITILVTAQDGSTTRTYTIAVTRAGPLSQSAYFRNITINTSQVLSAQTDFPILLSLSGDYLKTVPTGKVSNADGSDIYFTDSSGLARYYYEIEKYNGDNGTLVAWVNVPSLADGSALRMYYGGSGIGGTYKDSTRVWDSNFKGVWHMAQSAGVTDSTSNGNNGSDNNGVISSASTNMDGAKSLDGVDDYISIPNSGSLAFAPTGAGGDAGGMYTWQAWVKRQNTGSVGGTGIIGESTYPSKGFEISMVGNSNGYNIRFRGNNGTKNDVTFDSQISNFDTWYQVTIVYNNGEVRCYLNGNPDGANPQTVSALGDNTDAIYLGRWRNANEGYLNGMLDEIEFSNVARDAVWIKTAYNNQSNPGAFYTLGTEIANPVLDHLTISPANPSVNSGSQQTFTAQGYDSGNNPVSATFTWSCTNATAGSIDSVSGVFTAGTVVGLYTNVITATSGSVTGSTSVTVTSTVLDHIVVTPVNATFYRGGHRTYTAQGYDSSSNLISGLSFTWNCNNAAGTINSSTGYFTAGTALGTFTGAITATCGSITGTASVSVAVHTWYVEPTGGADIQAAINVASEGDTIIIRDGTYTENISVNKSLTLRSEHGPAGVIIHPASASSNIVTVTAYYVTIDGLTISGSASYTGNGIECSGEYTSLINNVISDVNVGIQVRNTTVPAGHHFISNNSISINNTPTNLIYYAVGSVGILIYSSSNNTITNNIVSGPTGASDSKGIMLFTQNLSNMSQNDVVAGNTCSNNTYGIYLQHVVYVSIYKNNFSNNNYGIFMRQNGYDTVTKYNTFYLNNIAGSTTANTGFLSYNLVNNGTIGNYDPIFNSDNYWNSQSPISYTYNGISYTGIAGNYWGGYFGTDANNDGIGDEGYLAQPYFNEYDNATLMAPFANYLETPNKPAAAFSANITSGKVPLTVVFTDQSVRASTAWAWDFNNDGTVDSTLQRPSYTYSANGVYSVKLKVTNASGSDTLVKTDYISIINHNITATAAAHVNITPSGSITVDYGADQTFAIAPDSGYVIADVMVDGVSVGPVTSFTFSNVTTDHSIVAYPADSNPPTWPNMRGSHSIDTHQVPLTYVCLYWSGASDDTAVTGFRVYMKNGATGESSIIATVPAGLYENGGSTWQGEYSIWLPTHNTDTVYYFKVQAGDPSSNWSDFNYFNHPETDGCGVSDGPSAIPTPPSWPADSYLQAYNVGTPLVPQVFFSWSQPTDGENGGAVRGYSVKASAVSSPPPNFIDSMTFSDAPDKWRDYDNRTYLWAGDNPNINYNYGQGGYTGESMLFAVPEVNQSYYFQMRAFDRYDSQAALGPIVRFNTAWTNSPLPYTTIGSMNMSYPSSTLTYAQATGPDSKQTYYSTVNSPTDPANTYFKLGSSGDAAYPAIAVGGSLSTYNIQLINKSTGAIITLPADTDGLSAFDSWSLDPAAWSSVNGTYYGYKTSLTDANGDNAFLEIHLPALSSGTTYILTLKSALTSNFNGAAYSWEFTTGQPAPVAAFTADVISGAAPLTVTFTDQSTNSPTGWLWDFNYHEGDSDIGSTEQNPSHDYLTPGTYTVKLTATNSTGSDDEVKTAFIIVTAKAWYVSASGSDATGDGSITNPFATIQKGINTAGVGETVIVKDGNYPEILTIGKALTLRSEHLHGATLNPALPTAPQYGKIITITASNVIIDGLNFTQPANNYGNYGIYTSGVNCNNCTFTNNNMVNIPTGIYLGNTGVQSDGHVITNNIFSWESYGACGIWLYNSRNSVIDNNTISHCAGNGIYLRQQGGTYCDHNTISGNTVFGSGNGIYLKDVSSNTISNNTFSGDSYGVYFESQNFNVTSNVFYLNSFIGSTSANLYLWARTSYTSSTGNIGNFWNSPTPVTYWYNGIQYTGIVGNYWGNYFSGIDASPVDGIGDTAYTTRTAPDEFDSYPLMFPVSSYSQTPVSPVAEFTSNLQSGYAPLTVNFVNLSTGSAPLTYEWDFDNNTSVDSTLQNPSCTYYAAGVYSVKLKVINSEGGSSLVKTQYISVLAATAAFTSNGQIGHAPYSVTFTDQSTGAGLTYAWNFKNDGTATSTLQNPSYTYDTPGNYTVKLTVTNDYGSDMILKTNYITVRPAGPWIVNASGDGDFPTIQAAVNVALAGETIIVKNGSYPENVAVSKALTIQAENPGDVTVNPASGHIFTVTASNVTIDGFSIISPTSGSGQYGIYLNGAYSNCTFKSNTISNIKYGVYAYNGANNSTIRNNSITLSSASTTAGIYLQTNTSGNTVTANTVNLGTGTSYGIYLQGSGGNTIFNNTVIDSNHKTTSYGFYFTGTSAINNTVYRNAISGTNYGLRFASSAVSNTFYENSFTGITTMLYSGSITGNIWKSPSQVTYWYNGSQFTGYLGNYWGSAYSGIDAGTPQDGVGDTAFTVVGTDVDNYPMMFNTAVEFTADHQSGSAPLTVSFSDQSIDAGVLTYAWDFDNNTTVDSTVQNPTYTFANPGDYTVKLTVSNVAGVNSEIKTDYITVSGFIPTLTWAVPESIAFGTALSGAQLNATATYNGNQVNGTLTYTPPVGTVLGAGLHTLNVLFTPDDSFNYVTATYSVQLQVNKVVTALTVDDVTATYGAQVQLSAWLTSDGSGVGGRTVNFTLNQEAVGSAVSDVSGLAALNGVSLRGLSIGTYPDAIEVVANGDDNFTASSSSSDLIINSLRLNVNLVKGWNTLSTPASLDNNTIGEIMAGSSYARGFSFDAQQQLWVKLNDNYTLNPGDSIYVFMDSDDSVTLITSAALNPPTTRELKAGWNLVGLANLSALKANEAMLSAADVRGGLAGYSQVISQTMGSQEGWVYVKGQIVSDGPQGWMQPYLGYWVFMVNDGVLAGFTATPLSAMPD